MSIPTAISQLLTSLESPNPEDSITSDPTLDNAPTSAVRLDPETTLAVSVSRLGSSTQTFRAGSLSQLAQLDPEAFGAPLHSLIVIGNRLNPIERDYMSEFAVDRDQWLRLTTDHYHCA